MESCFSQNLFSRCFDEHKRTPLHFAAAMGYTEVADILLKNGADPNQKVNIAILIFLYIPLIHCISKNNLLNIFYVNLFPKISTMTSSFDNVTRRYIINKYFNYLK